MTEEAPPTLQLVGRPDVPDRSDRLPTVYVSGDNASVDVVRAMVAEHGPVDVATPPSP